MYLEENKLDERFDGMINTEREGVSAVQSIVYKDLKWIFREQAIGDFGIDAEIDITNQKYPTGKVIGVQIKSGASYFRNSSKEGVVFRFEEKHKKYWLKHTFPVIVLLYHPDSQECIWEAVDEFTVKQISEKNYKIVIPKENEFGVSTKEKLVVLAYLKNIEDLAEEIDELDVDKEVVFAILDERQKQIFRLARKAFDKKNAASDSMPFEYNLEEFSDFVNTITPFDSEDNLIIGERFIKLCHDIEQYIYSAQPNPLIILGEAGSGKTTLVRTVIKKFGFKYILYIQPRNHENVLDRIQKECKNCIRAVIIDGWDALFPEKRLKIWHELVEWRNCHKNIKVIITSRYVEKNIWESANFLRIPPLTQQEALTLLRMMTGSDFEQEESVLRFINVFNTPLMLKMLVMVTRQQSIPLEEATKDELLFTLISKYSDEESQILENIAFKMMKENKMTLKQGTFLEHLSTYRELHLENNTISFSHKAFYEIFVAKYVFRHIFEEEKEPEEFNMLMWDIFSDSLCSLEILNYLKYLIKHMKLNESFLKQLNNNFMFMIERGMLTDSFENVDLFKAISNVFYMMWHIVSYVNRMYCGGYKLEIPREIEPSFSCIINIFNRIYFNHVYLDFSYLDVSYIKLWRSNLANMNFRNSKLCHGNFMGSCLDGSNFQQADLSYCNFVATDLRHANLRDTNLTSANVSNCMISEDSFKYFIPFKDTLRNAEKMIVFMNDGTIKKFLTLL